MSNASSKADKDPTLTPVPDTHADTPGRLQTALVSATWGPVAAILVTIATFLFANAGASVLIALLPQLLGRTQQQVERWIDGGVSAQFVFIIMVEAITLGIIWWFMRRRKGTLAMIGLGRLPRWGDLGQGILGLFVYFGAFIAVAMLSQWLLPINTDQQQDLGFDTYGHSGLALSLIFVSLVVLPPITEEILFRGFLLSGLRKGMGIGIAVLLNSLLFGALHLLGGMNGEGLLWIAGIDTFILALVLCYLRSMTAALYAPILVHAAKNAVAFFSLFIFHLG